MAINLHEQAKETIRASLAENLKYVRVKHGMLIQHFTVFMAAFDANKALPNGKILDNLIDYIDEFPIIEFVTELLRRELNENEKYIKDEEEQKSLLDIDYYKDADKTAKRIVNLLESLPWDYSISLEIPEKLLSANVIGDDPIELDSGRIRNFDLLMNQNYPLTHENPNIQNIGESLLLSALTGSDTPSWKDCLYFQQEEKGFIGLYGSGSVMDRVNRRFESFLGLGLSMRLFSYQYRYENEDPICKWIVHQNMNGNWRFSTRFKLDDDIKDVMKHLNPFNFEKSYPENNRPIWLNKTSRSIGEVMLSENSKTLKLAAKWFFDSFKGNDETLKYIRMMTSLEILLGEHADSSKASLGDILGNRLAYMIGKNHNDRAEVLKNFKRIYRIRSAILHHGKHRLRGEEKIYITMLRKFCERAIEEEARLILA